MFMNQIYTQWVQNVNGIHIKPRSIILLKSISTLDLLSITC